MLHHFRFSCFLMVIVVLSCLATSAVAGCLCARGAFKTRWQGAAVVFHGTVKEIKLNYELYENEYDDKPVDVIFEVSEYFKGGNGTMTTFPLKNPIPLMETTRKGALLETGRRIVPETDEDKTFTMHTSLQHVTCMGSLFEEGADYLVYAYLREEGSGNRWSLYHYPSGTYGAGGLCGGTVIYNTPEAQRDLDHIYIFLSRGKPPKTGG